MKTIVIKCYFLKGNQKSLEIIMLSKIKPGLLSGIGWEENMVKGNSVTENLPQRKKNLR